MPDNIKMVKKKRVTFGNVTVVLIPGKEEERKGWWAADASRFKMRIHQLEQQFRNLKIKNGNEQKFDKPKNQQLASVFI